MPDNIERIVQRDLDQLPLLPPERWIPKPKRRRFAAPSWLRSLAVVPATVLIALVAVAAGTQLADWRAQRDAAVGQAAIGAIPGPLALAGGSPSDGFGLISTSANDLLVRSEAVERAQLVIPGGLAQLAVSPSGKDLAYWRAGTDAKTGERYFALHVTDVIDAIGAADANGRLGATVGLTYLTSTDESPFAVQWSSDGTGLITGTRTPPRRDPLAPPQSPDHQTWFAIDLATRKVDRLAGLDQMTTVYAWDRQRDLVTGSGFNAGETTFVARTAGRVTTTALPKGSLLAAADAYGRSVVLAYAGACTGVVGPANCPVLEIRDQATFAIVTTARLGERTTDYPDVAFRPRSQDLIVQLPLPNGVARIELWNDLGRGPHRVLASFSQSGRFTARRELVLPRVDGSAVFLLKFDDSQGGRWFGELASLSDTSRTAFEIRAGGNPLASVVLDPAFAKALAPSRPAAVASPRPTPAIPTCSAGLPALDVAGPPAPGPVPGSGSANAEAAFRKARPDLTSFDMYPFGSDQKARSASELGKGPVWIVAGDQTFIAVAPGESDGNNWFAYPAKFLGCRDLPAAPPVANIAGWASGHVPTASIIEILNRAGFRASASPPAPSRVLLFNATDLDLVAIDAPEIPGFTVYRYPDAAVARAAWSLEAVQDPRRGTILWRAQPYFVLVGDALINFVTDDPATAKRVIDALMATPAAQACASVTQAVLPAAGAGGLYPTRTATEVLSGLPSDPYFRHTLEDIAGVRQDPNPLRDSGVPRCAVDALTVGDPIFVRRYPSTAGTWYVPVLYQGRQLLIVRVLRDEAGVGAYSGSGGSGEPFPGMSAARAMQVAGSASDAAVSAELVFARASSPESVAWRVIRASGSVFYVFPSFPGGGPDGLILPASQVQLGSGN